MTDVTNLTNPQRRCVWSVGRFKSWDVIPQKYRGQCMDLDLIEWHDGPKLTVEGDAAYRELVRLSTTTGSYLR